MERHSSLKTILLLVAIAVITYFSLNPLAGINLGLDLQGGAQVRLQAVPDDGGIVTSADMDKVAAVMRKRIDGFGISEPVIQREGADRLIVELAGVDDPDKAIELLGKTARLEFRDPQGNVMLTGADLSDAHAVIDNGVNKVTLDFTREGAEKFANATAKLIGSIMYIYLDDVQLSEPRVNQVISGGNAEISGGFATYQEAADLAALLRGGALPVNIEILSKQTVGPVLGQDSLNKSLVATAIGMTLLLLFMIGYYRLPGVIAGISLVVYALILLWVLKLLGATLTLPGIAGFVLSIGMGVDSNIIIYERIKEELKAGKSLRAGINAGFKRAFATIIDSNVTTFVAVIVLFIFGTGPIQGFALTLGIGLAANLFTAITFTRMMLNLISNIKGLKSTMLYGVSRRG